MPASFTLWKEFETYLFETCFSAMSNAGIISIISRTAINHCLVSVLKRVLIFYPDF
jgi:hypothetical protein